MREQYSLGMLLLFRIIGNYANMVELLYTLYGRRRADYN